MRSPAAGTGLLSITCRELNRVSRYMQLRELLTPKCFKSLLSFLQKHLQFIEGILLVCRGTPLIVKSERDADHPLASSDTEKQFHPVVHLWCDGLNFYGRHPHILSVVLAKISGYSVPIGSLSRFMTNSMLWDWISRQVSTLVSYRSLGVPLEVFPRQLAGMDQVAGELFSDVGVGHGRSGECLLHAIEGMMRSVLDLDPMRRFPATIRPVAAL
jgi:hypothetical protein